MGCIFDFVKLNASAIAVAAVVQQVAAFVWYGLAFSTVFKYYFAVDKGVKRAEYAKIRYSMALCSGGSLVQNVVRAAATAVIVGLAAGNKAAAGSSTLCAYSEAAFFVAAIAVATRVNYSLWEQQPLPLVLIAAGNEVVNAAVAATVLFFLKDIKGPF